MVMKKLKYFNHLNKKMNLINDNIGLDENVYLPV